MNTKHITSIFAVLILTVLCASAYVSVPTITDGIGFQYENITIGDDRIQIGDTNITKAATFVIAASDSQHKYGADFICDGVDDQVEIQAAIDAITADGGTIQFMDGDFRISNTINVTKSIYFKGMGVNFYDRVSTRLTLEDGASSGTMFYWYNGGTSAALHIFFGGMEQIEFNGNRDNNINFTTPFIDIVTASDLIIRDCIFHEIPSYHEVPIIKMHGHAWGNWITCNDFENSDGIAIEAHAHRNWIVDNHFMLVHRGVVIESDSGQSQYRGTGWITDNTFRDIYKNAIYLRESYGTIICGNTFAEISTSPTFDHAAIDVESPTDTAIISNNYFIYNTGSGDSQYGVYMRDPAGIDYVHIHNNDFRKVGTAGIYTTPGANLHGSVRNNKGHVTENSGTTTLVSGTTSITVTHGLSVTPSAGDIMVSAMESLGSASFFWIDGYTSTIFNVTVNTDPTQDVDFAWSTAIY